MLFYVTSPSVDSYWYDCFIFELSSPTTCICFAAFRQLMRDEGSDLLIEKVKLSSLTNPPDVRIEKLMSAVEAMTCELKYIKDRVIEMQTGVHATIEDSRARRREHLLDSDIRRIQKACLESKLKEDKTDLNDTDLEMAKLNTEVQQLEYQIREAENQARQKRTDGIVSAVKGGLGLVLAPLSGTCCHYLSNFDICPGIVYKH